MDTKEAEALLQRLAPAMAWAIAQRQPGVSRYLVPAFVHAPVFPCEPLPVHWDGVTTAAVCLRLDLGCPCISQAQRLEVRRLLPAHIGTDGCLYLLAGTTRSQLQNRQLLEDQLARLLL